MKDALKPMTHRIGETGTTAILVGHDRVPIRVVDELVQLGDRHNRHNDGDRPFAVVGIEMSESVPGPVRSQQGAGSR
jgi:hypothetical protein